MTKLDTSNTARDDCVTLCKFCRQTTQDWQDPMWCDNPDSDHYLHVLVCGHLMCEKSAEWET